MPTEASIINHIARFITNIDYFDNLVVFVGYQSSKDGL
jgi:hypothetical protein